MRIHHLNCGTMCPFSRKLVNGEGGLFASGEMVCHCLLIETPNSGLVLVDTGFGLDDIREPARRLGPIRHLLRGRLDTQEAAVTQIEALGFSRSDVRHIVLTHLDLDHAGGLSDFPEAAVHLLEQERHDGVNVPDKVAKQRYRTMQWSHGPRWEAYEPSGESWKGFECVRELRGLPPEILLVPVAGHTRGHACIAVERSDDWLLHCGDAYFSHQSMMRGGKVPAGLRLFQRAAAMNYDVMLQNQARLRELNERDSDVKLVCSHDPQELAGC